MRNTLRIRPAADSDVDDAALFIARDNLAAALQFYDAVDQTYRQIRSSPNRWPKYELNEPRLVGLRRRSVVGFKNYLVFYLLQGNVVDVVRVLHGARDIPAILAVRR